MASTESILSIRGIRKSFRGIRVLEGVSFDLHAGTITALVGSNGAGKSTLVNVLGGVLQPDDGEILLHGRDVVRMPAHARARAGLLRTFQHPRVFGSFTVAESVALAGTPATAEGFWPSLWSALRSRRGSHAPSPAARQASAWPWRRASWNRARALSSPT